MALLFAATQVAAIVDYAVVGSFFHFPDIVDAFPVTRDHRHLLQASPCVWAEDQCMASREAVFPDNDLTLAVADHRAKTTVCLSWMEVGTGRCRVGALLATGGAVVMVLVHVWCVSLTKNVEVRLTLLLPAIGKQALLPHVFASLATLQPLWSAADVCMQPHLIHVRRSSSRPELGCACLWEPTSKSLRTTSGKVLMGCGK